MTVVAVRIFLLLLILAQSAIAQSPCGIFATRADFIEGRITFPVFNECAIAVRANKDLVALQGPEKVRFKFDHIYGYTDGKNKYRAYGKQSLLTDHAYYKIVYNAELVLYARRTMDYRGKRYTTYYYSLALDSPIFPLNRKFIRRDPDDPKKVIVHLAKLRNELGLKTEGDRLKIATDNVIILP